jgi:hypothetical protein
MLLYITSCTINVKNSVGWIGGEVTDKKKFSYKKHRINTCSQIHSEICATSYHANEFSREHQLGCGAFSTPNSRTTISQQRSGAICLVHRAFPTISTGSNGFAYSRVYTSATWPETSRSMIHHKWAMQEEGTQGTELCSTDLYKTSQLRVNDSCFVYWTRRVKFSARRAVFAIAVFLHRFLQIFIHNSLT